MNKQKRITIIIPSFNEEDNIKELFKELTSTLQDSVYFYEYLFIDDGSTDYTLEVIKRLCLENKNTYFIQLSRNFGHQSALKAGLDYASGDCVISMDSDLQHPPDVIHKLLEKWEEGYDVVYTKRNDAAELPWFKRKTSSLFYDLYNQLSDMKIEKGTADFRLMSRNVVDAFSKLQENDLFIRGLVKWAGFKQTFVEYHPNKRFAGKTKYSILKMLSFAFRGLTAFSTKPLKLIVYISLIFVLLSLFLVPYTIISFLLGKTVSGWSSLMITVIFFGSFQLLIMGVIGLYVSKLVIQSKYRPTYIVRESNYSPTR